MNSLKSAEKFPLKIVSYKSVPYKSDFFKSDSFKKRVPWRVLKSVIKVFLIRVILIEQRVSYKIVPYKCDDQLVKKW